MIYELAPARTALLVIDAQREYFDEDGALYTPHAAEIRENLKRLIDAARAAHAQVVFIRHVMAADGADAGRMGDFGDSASFVAGTKGVELADGIEPEPGEPVVDKTRYSAFVNTRLPSILKTSGADTLIITGLMTQYCSVTTARHGHDLDYRVVFVSDANAGPDLPDAGFGAVPHAEAMRTIATSLSGGIADVVQTDAAIAELERAASAGSARHAG
ncbi:MAG TPA: isochorismatase family cysteine hydrolase [Solirubrobacteraceae bacterium]